MFYNLYFFYLYIYILFYIKNFNDLIIGAIHIFIWMLICSNISKRILNAIKTYRVELNK